MGQRPLERFDAQGFAPRRLRPVAAAMMGAAILATFVGCSNSGDPFGHNPTPTLGITAVSPADGSINVSPATNVAIAFPLDLDIRTVTRENVLLTVNRPLGAAFAPPDDRKTIAVRVVYDAPTRTITIAPLTPLITGATYDVLLQDVRTSDDSIVFNTQATQFTVGSDANPTPTVVSTSPLNGQVEIPDLTPINVKFSQVMDHLSLQNAFTIFPATPGTVTFVDTTTSTTFTYTPGAHYPDGQRVTFGFLAQATTTQNRPLAGAFSASFVPEKPPAVDPLSVNPADNTAGISTNTTVTLDFTRVMDQPSVTLAMTLQFGSTILGPANGTYTFSTVSTDSSGNPSPPHTRVVYTPTAALPASTSVQIRVTGTAHEAVTATSSGPGLDPDFIATFATGT